MTRTTMILLGLWVGALLIQDVYGDEANPQAATADKKESSEKKPVEKKDAPQNPDPKWPAEKKPPESPPEFDPKWVDSLSWRSIGPASMGGRIVALAVVESDPTTFYVATASGGLFKTTNNGTTFTAIFEKQSTVSIGDVCVAPSDPNVVWVGTGEHNGRNSVSWGDGVYKSTNGGKSWQHMGLKRSFQIGRIAIHPTNPDIVYVGALGRLWGPNEERGVFKTSDGGKTWKKVLYVDNKTGCVEVAMHPRDPNTLLVGMYERQRDAFDGGDPLKRWGPGSGIYKTTDGGGKWKKLSKGLPNRPLGRIGIEYFRGEANTVYAMVESDKIGTGRVKDNAYMGISGGRRVPRANIQQVLKGGPADKAGIKNGDVVVEMAGKKVASYNDLVVAIRRHKAGEKVKIKLQRDGKPLEVELTFGDRNKQKGGKKTMPYGAYLGGQRANAQKQQGPDGVNTGGLYKSTDGGESWTRTNSINPRPFYYSQIRIDPTDDRYQYVLGVRFNTSTDGGAKFTASRSRVHADHHELWIDPRDGRHLILGCDGGLYISYDRGTTWDFHNIMAIGQFYDVGIGTGSPYWVYGGLQDNGSWGAPSRKRGSSGPANSDWLRIGGGDGFVCRVDPLDPELVYYESQYGRMGRVNVKTGARARIAPVAEKDKPFRFNWKTPFLLSHHNSKIFYCAGNYVFRSLDRGNDLKRISPKITRGEKGSATAIDESPKDQNVIYVGTDDGALWVTRNGGHDWQDVTKSVGLPGPFHVASIEASQHAAGRAYVAFDAHRSNNDDPHVYVTEDYGKTWKSLRANLPSGSSRTLREDPANANLLYCGTEFAVWASLDRGASWLKINANLPTVAIHEIAVHPTRAEIVAGTHGRSVWILDVTPLRQFSREVAAAKVHLFRPPGGVLWGGALSASRSGDRNFAGQNPSFGTSLHYYLSAKAKNVALEIVNVKGEVIRKLKVEKKPGLHRASWDLRRAGQRGSRGQRGRGAAPVKPGAYLARLTVDGKTLVQEIQVAADPERPAALLQEELEQHERKNRPAYIE
ncbi:MAG: PDZ domain-containing protein [Planctomycetes bacterium]|nr:PDZ domain-containing protein [Planctomycetota bacterium]